MANLTSINLTILVLSKKLQALQVQTKTKTPATKRTSIDEKTKDDKSK